MKIKTLGIVSFIGFIISGILLYLGFFITETGRHSPDNCTKTVRAEVIGYDYMYTPDEIELSTPQFQFKFRGNTYVSQFHGYCSEWDDYQIGTWHYLRVNPYNLDEIRPFDRWQTIVGSYYIQNICIGAIIGGLSIVGFALTLFRLLINRKKKAVEKSAV